MPSSARINTGRTNRSAQPSPIVSHRTPRSARPESARRLLAPHVQTPTASARARQKSRSARDPDVFARLTSRSNSNSALSPSRVAGRVGEMSSPERTAGWAELPAHLATMQSTLDGTFPGTATSLVMAPRQRRQHGSPGPNVTGTLFLPGTRPPDEYETHPTPTTARPTVYGSGETPQCSSRSSDGRNRPASAPRQLGARSQTAPSGSSRRRNCEARPEDAPPSIDVGAIKQRMKDRADAHAARHPPKTKQAWGQRSQFSVPQISQEMPLRTVYLDGKVNTLPRSMTRSDLLKKHRMIDMPHMSYDIDGDGVVSPYDMAISKRIDEEGTGMLTNEQREKGKLEMARQFLHQNFSRERTGIPAEDDPQITQHVANNLLRVKKMDTKVKLASSVNAALALKPQTQGQLRDPPNFQKSLQPGDPPIALATSHSGSRAKLFEMRRRELIDKFNSQPHKSYADGYDLRRVRVLFREETQGQRNL